MVTYIVKHHIPGFVRLEIPILRELSALRLEKITKAVRSLPVLTGIRDIAVNPLNCSVDIEYDPVIIDIKDYIEDMASIVETLDYVILNSKFNIPLILT